ncbi:MAG TPA: hypothetical protein VGS79_01895 [Puia sp.]|nr:hypothetical protein [Puia sp.]
MTNALLPLGLVLHISGITLMAGTFFAGFLTNRQLWKYLPYNKDQALSIARATSRFRITQAIGGGLILVGGIAMMMAVHGVFMHQSWFKVKLGLLGLLILNMIVVERPAAKRLKQMLSGENRQIDPATLTATQRTLGIFNALQLALFLAIFILSSYKFN